MAEQQPALYRFYKLGADDHMRFGTRTTLQMMLRRSLSLEVSLNEYPGVEIWCEQRKIATLSREEALLQQTKKDS